MANSSTSASPLVRFWNEKAPILKFLLGFVGFMLLFYLFYYSSLYQNVLGPPLENFQARISAGILQLLGHDTHVSGDTIAGSEFSVSIANGCDGLEPLAMLFGGILLFPLAFKYKWPGLLAGVVVLFILNLLRIAGLYLAGIYIFSAFEFLHLHGGFVIFTIITIILWMTWANWAMRRKKEEAAA